MTKFASIWGELSVGNITPAPAGNPPEAPEAPPANVPDEDDKNNIDVEDDGDVVITPPIKPDTPTNTPPAENNVEGDVLEYTDDEVRKAYTMLIDEGVLDLTDDDEFEESPKGLGDAVAATVRNKLKAEIASIPPTVQDYYAFVMEGNDPRDFKPAAAFSWEDADHSDIEVQKASLKRLYLDQGMTEAEALEEIEDAEAADKLEKKSGIALATLIKKEQDEKTARTELEKKNEQAALKKQKDEISKIEKTIDEADEYAGFKLDEKRKKAFKDYLFKVNPRTGKTQMQENMMNADRKLTVAFLDFVNYSKADLEKEVASGLTKDRKKKLARFTDKNVANVNGSKSVTTKTNTNRGKIKFPTIFGNTSIELED